MAKTSAQKKQSFEQSLERLEQIINEMERSETTLEQSLALYTEGINLSIFCGERLTAAEKEITMLKCTADEVLEQVLFDTQSNDSRNKKNIFQDEYITGEDN